MTDYTEANTAIAPPWMEWDMRGMHHLCDYKSEIDTLRADNERLRGLLRILSDPPDPEDAPASAAYELTRREAAAIGEREGEG